ncbi:MAG: cytochrome c biogenesis protein CcsA [Gammaproteobacteria bacterium]|nr:cytochrome c biogenesis protein CcsA [Gammaproteobacteria bacterium]
MITPTIAAGLTAVLLYMAGTVFQVRAFVTSSAPSVRSLVYVAIPALLLHGLANYGVIFTEPGFNLGIFTVGSLIAWVMMAFVLLSMLRLPVHNLLTLVFPISAIGLVTAMFLDSNYAPREVLSGSLIFHILASLAAYSILLMAACQSVVLAFQEHYIRTRHSISLIRILPPLETMEALLFNLLWVGIIVLTVAILSGYAFLDDMFAQDVSHHTVLSSASWITYAALLAGHKFFGWRGTTAVRWTLIAFSLLVLGYFGSKFVYEIILGG